MMFPEYFVIEYEYQVIKDAINTGKSNTPLMNNK